MPKFTVYLTTTASTSVEVEAEDVDAAIDAAYEANMPTLCAQCSGWGGRQGMDLSDVWEMSEVANEAGEIVLQRDRPASATGTAGE